MCETSLNIYRMSNNKNKKVMGNFNADLTERETKTKHVSFTPLGIPIHFSAWVILPNILKVINGGNYCFPSLLHDISVPGQSCHADSMLGIELPKF